MKIKNIKELKLEGNKNFKKDSSLTGFEIVKIIKNILERLNILENKK